MDSIIHSINQQLLASHFLANAYDSFVSSGSPIITKQRIDSYLVTLADLWTKFNRNHDAILTKITRLEKEERLMILSHSYFTEKTQADTHMCYLAAVERIKDSQNVEPSVAPRASISVEQPVAAGSSSNQSLPYKIPTSNGSQYARLPRIEIPKFDGNPSKWLNYRDLFASLVLSSKSLTAVEKLQYLKTSLTGTASHLIQNTTLTAENFSKAWESLVSFYDNPRLQVHTALHSLFNLKSMTKESSNDLEHLYTTVLQIHRTLETLQRPVETWDDVFVYATVQRLDSESVKAWESTLGSSKIPPSWKELIEFLVTRLFSLQAYEKCRGEKVAQQHPKTAANVHHQQESDEASSSNTLGCSICEGEHYVVKCPQYVDETVAQRLALIVKHQLCYNCLRKHRVANCKVVKRCKKCGKKHHTTIHREEFSSTTDEVGSESQQKSESSVQSNSASE
ncbi:uncharacterized protein [Temnothorax nylanderi]|uniref:uncharacterized protein n=1 Tax=Temnothorax nylanderi TaxID=102681 RepID=UPI003A8C40F2